MSVRQVRKLMGCMFLVTALVCAVIGEAFAVPAINCSTAKNKCNAAVTASKNVAKTMNKESHNLEKYQSTFDRYTATYDDCVASIDDRISVLKINAQEAAETCGGGVAAAVNSAEIWSSRQLESANETNTLKEIGYVTDARFDSFAGEIESLLADLVGLPEPCNSLSKIIGNPGRCIDAVRNGNGCSTVEVCGYVNFGGLRHIMKKCNGQDCTEAQCQPKVESCKADKRAELEMQQAVQRAACASIKQRVRNVFKLKVKIRSCGSRRDSKIKRLQSKINNAKRRYCTASTNFPAKLAAENTKCAALEGEACQKQRKSYVAPEETTVVCE